MAKTRSESKKTIPEGGAMVIELFGPTSNPPKPNGSVFEKPAPNEWKPKWLRNIDFLFVCTGLCAGLGNLWRFPSVALEYGGGSFLVAYLIILLFMGIPAFYLEVVMGQFVSRAGARLFDCVPILRGLGYGQMFLSFAIASYYAGISAQAGKFLVGSMRQVLPWAKCSNGTHMNCSLTLNNSMKAEENVSLAEVYYRQNVIADVSKSSPIEPLIPNLELVVYLLICWMFVTLILIKGTRILSQLSGFLIFTILSIAIVIIAQTVFLPGATEGILKFFTPEWKYFMRMDMWYEATVQVFFSLGLCFGPVTMYSSFNRFSYNMFLDILITVFINMLIIVATGCTYFAIIGNLAESSGLPLEDFGDRFDNNVFVVYSEVIAKFDYVPQVSSAIIFFLYYLLGIASVSALTFFIVHMIRDEFLIRRTLNITIFITTLMLLVSCIYLAPIGKYLVVLLDTTAVPFAIGLNSIMEFVALAWIYGVKRVCDDIEFMFGFRTRFIWRVLWCLLPIMIAIPYALYWVHYGLRFDLLISEGISLLAVGCVIGLVFLLIIALSISIWGIFVVLKQPKLSCIERIKLGAIPDSNWGPADTSLLLNYRYFILKKDNTTT